MRSSAARLAKAGASRNDGEEARQERALCWANNPRAFLLFAATLRIGKVVRVPRLGVVVNDADVARAILTDGKRFNSHDEGSFGAMITEVLGPRALINMDGPEHQALKRDLLNVFSNKYVSSVIEETTGGLVAELVTRLARGEAVDFAAFMREYGCAMACALIGVKVDPDHQRAAYDDIFELATEIMAFARHGRPRLSDRELATARDYAERLGGYIEKSYAEEDGLDVSLTRRLKAQGAPFETVRGLVSVVLVGATELVIYGLPRALAVMIDSGAFPALQKDPALLDSAIDEALRLTTPSNVILRVVSEDCVVGPAKFRAKDRVLIAFRNIMRDNDRFATPDRFVLQRNIDSTLRRLPFGAGPHTCLGAALTLAEMRQTLSALAGLSGRLRIVERTRQREKLYPGYGKLVLKLNPPSADDVS